MHGQFLYCSIGICSKSCFSPEKAIQKGWILLILKADPYLYINSCKQHHMA